MLRSAPHCTTIMDVDTGVSFFNLQPFPSPHTMDSYSPNTPSDAGGGESFMATCPPMLEATPALPTSSTGTGSDSYDSDPNMRALPAISMAPTMPESGYESIEDSLAMFFASDGSALDTQPAWSDGTLPVDAHLQDIVDLGPPPMPVSPPMPASPPRVADEDLPRNKQSAYAPSENDDLPPFKNKSGPNSPGDGRRRTIHGGSLDNVLHGHGRGRRGRFVHVGRSFRNGKLARGTTPMFPEQSTPLFVVSRQSVSASSSVSISSTKSDPFGTISSHHSAVSDPGVYANHADARSFSHHDSPALSAHSHSPALSTHGESNSPKFTFGGLQPSQVLETTTRSNMEMDTSVKHARRIMDLDKRILKLQAERAKYLADKVPKLDTPSEEKWSERWAERQVEKGRIHLFVTPLNIHALDEPFYEAAHTLLRQIGGLNYDLNSALSNLRSICCKGMFIVPDMSTCFAFIKSLLHRNQQLKLICSIRGIYTIQLAAGSDLSGSAVPEFEYALGAANNVLQCAQHITLAFTHIQERLKRVQEMAVEKIHLCDSICQQLGMMDRERRTYIRSVVEGNNATVFSAVKVWSQYYKNATDTIQSITECIHPTHPTFMN